MADVKSGKAFMKALANILMAAFRTGHKPTRLWICAQLRRDGFDEPTLDTQVMVCLTHLVDKEVLCLTQEVDGPRTYKPGRRYNDV